MRRSTPQPAAPKGRPPPAAGDVVEGFRLGPALSTRPGLYTHAHTTTKDGKPVSVKVLDQRAVDAKHRRSIEKLASSRASIKHPNLVPLVRVIRGGSVVVLGAVPEGAETLEDRLARGEMDAAEAVRLLSQVAGALDAALGRGLAHRELSPAAILLTAADPPEALLTDFGLTAAPARACERVGAVDDADYRSPEEILGKPADARSNVYSLACILVECLTGRPPYPYDRPVLAHHAHLAEAPPKVSERDDGLPPALDEVVARAMAKKPEDRYRRPGDLMRAVQAELGVQAPIPVPARRPAPRNANRPRKRQQARRERRRVRRRERRAAAARS
jgi:serine/threonine protein kinase